MERKKSDEIKEFESIIYNFKKSNCYNKIYKILGTDNLYKFALSGLIFDNALLCGINGTEVMVYLRAHVYILREDVEDELKRIENEHPKVLTTTESINYILENKSSLARFGDGELNLCEGIGIPFQEFNAELERK